MEQNLLNCFYGQEINDKQMLKATDLPRMDPAGTSCALEFKANTLGIRTQLGKCGKVSDKQGNALTPDRSSRLLPAEALPRDHQWFR